MASSILDLGNNCKVGTDEHAEDEVRFAGATDPGSFVGPPDEGWSMSDDTILAYIYQSDPVLYDRLVAHTLGETLPVLPCGSLTLAANGSTNALTACGNTAPFSLAEIGKTVRPTELRQDLVLVQMKQKIIELLMKHHVLVLQCIAWLDNALCRNLVCKYALCAIPTGTYILSLESMAEVEAGFASINTQTHVYCLTCLERIFYTVRMDRGNSNLISPQANFDGTVDTAMALKAAARLVVPDDYHKPMELTTTISDECLLDLPSNSNELIALRQQRNQDTHEILGQVRQYEGREVSPSPESPSLFILKPTELGKRPVERYKKQGLTRYDKNGRDRTSRGGKYNTTVSPLNQSGSLSSTGSDDVEHLLCYCRGPENGEDMIHCSSEYCLIGWVHLRCSGLSRLPYLNELWFCRECSEGLTGAANDVKTYVIDHKTPGTRGTSFSWIETAQEFAGDSEEFYEEEEEEEYSSHEMPQTPTLQQSLTTIATPFQFLDGSTIPVKTYSLSPSTSKIRFSDLAPFIVARLRGNLSDKHLAALQTWKMSCPPSQVAGPGPNGTLSTKRLTYKKLSYVLSQVQSPESVDDLPESYKIF